MVIGVVPGTHQITRVTSCFTAVWAWREMWNAVAHQAKKENYPVGLFC